MTESLLVLVAGLAVRRFGIFTSSAMVEAVPGTDLIKIVAQVPLKKLRRFGAHPASHAYLSIPPASRPSQNPFSLSYVRFAFISNPFTVASVDEEAGELTLITRQMNGPISNTIARLASLRSSDTKVALNVDGPYGVSAHFPDLAGNHIDRVLFVAGGIGATFIMPLYEHIMTENPSKRVESVWVVRDANEVTWPVLTAGGSIYDEDNIRLFCTGNKTESNSIVACSSNGFDDIELNRLEKDNKRTANIPVENQKRPDLEDREQFLWGRLP